LKNQVSSLKKDISNLKVINYHNPNPNDNLSSITLEDTKNHCSPTAKEKPPTDIIYDKTNLDAADLHTILQAVNLGTDQIKIIVDNYVDWYGLLGDDIDGQYNFLKTKIRYQHAQKVLQESELTKYIIDTFNDIMSGSKILPLSPDHIGQASNVSSQHQLSDAIKLLIDSQTEVISACKTTV